VARFTPSALPDPVPGTTRSNGPELTRLEELQVQVAAATAADAAAAGVVTTGALMMSSGLLHRPGGAALELLQEAVDLILDTGR